MPKGGARLKKKQSSEITPEREIIQEKEVQEEMSKKGKSKTYSTTKRKQPSSIEREEEEEDEDGSTKSAKSKSLLSAETSDEEEEEKGKNPTKASRSKPSSKFIAKELPSGSSAESQLFLLRKQVETLASNFQMLTQVVQEGQKNMHEQIDRLWTKTKAKLDDPSKQTFWQVSSNAYSLFTL